MKTETLYDAFLNCLINKEFREKADYIAFRGAEFGAKWQAKRMYTEQEVYQLLEKRDMDLDYWYEWKKNDYPYLNEWFKQFKK